MSRKAYGKQLLDITLRRGLVLMVQADGDEGVRAVAERIYAAFGRAE